MEENSDPIPIDIILEILTKSSAKSVARFGLASKFCASILSRPDFTDLFLTRSSTRPRLLFAVKEGSSNLRLYSSPQRQNPDKNDHSLTVAADFHMQFLGYMDQNSICSLVSSLLYFSSIQISEDGSYDVPVICNPSTGQYARLPQLRRKRYSRSLLGYDPIDKEYKALAVTESPHGEEYILTLGTGKMSWRKIQLRVKHYPRSGGICINGVLYYIAFDYQKILKIACFDVRYEKLRFLDEDSITRIISTSSSPIKLINYKGKLGLISLSSFCRLYGLQYIKELRLRLWILEDAQKQEWLPREYTFQWNVAFNNDDISVVGVTAYGEIILSPSYLSYNKPFFVFHFNPERNTLEQVVIQAYEAPKTYSRVSPL